VRPAFEVADVINLHWKEIVRSDKFNTWQLRTLDAIRRCRTASLGGHVDLCTACGHIRISIRVTGDKYRERRVFSIR